jgi:hypothetical protein
LQPDVTRLASLKPGDHGLLDTEFRCELALRQSARMSQGDELLFNAHRLQLRLDGSGKIRVVFRPSIDGTNGGSRERHHYRPFFGFLNSAYTAACNVRSRTVQRGTTEV